MKDKSAKRHGVAGFVRYVAAILLPAYVSAWFADAAQKAAAFLKYYGKTVFADNKSAKSLAREVMR